jgi:O-antigen/teichoic acid export membrane protein
LALAARVLGPENFGLFSYALAIAAMLAVIGDLGINKIITRNLATNFENASKYGSSFIIQVIALIIYGSFGFFLLGLQQGLLIASLFLILGIFTASNILGDYIWAFFRAQEKMHYEAWVKTAQAILILIVGIVLLLGPRPLFGLAISYSIASIASLVVALHLIKRQNISLGKANFSVWIDLVRQSWPIALIAISAYIFNEIDSIMLGALDSFNSVGLYNAAYKIMSATLIPMFVINQAIFPKLSYSDKKTSRRLVRQNFVGNLVLYSLLATAMYWLAPELIGLLFGPEFVAGASTLFLLSLVAILTALMFPLSNYAIATDKLKVNLLLSLTAAGLNIFLNLTLIPIYSFQGAALATIITYAYLLIGYTVAWLFLDEEIHSTNRSAAI